MSRTYQDYEEEYNQNMARIRSLLAKTRTFSSLNEAGKCLADARSCAHALQALSEVAGDPLKTQRAQQRIFQEIGPQSKEIANSLRHLQNIHDLERSLPKDAPHPNDNQHLLNTMSSSPTDTPDQILNRSEQLLLESQALCASTEDIGTRTIEQMSIQREQLRSSHRYVDMTLHIANKAKSLLNEMRYRTFRNKLFLYTLIIFLIFANGLAMYRIMHKN